MEWRPHPASNYVRVGVQHRKYYSACADVQDMMWEIHPPAYFIRSRWYRFNKPRDQSMMRGVHTPVETCSRQLLQKTLGLKLLKSAPEVCDVKCDVLLLQIRYL